MLKDTQIKQLIRSLRQKAGLTQAQMAEKLGISRIAYREIECGATKITIELIERISEALNCPKDKIVMGYDLDAVQMESLRDSRAEFEKEILSLQQKVSELAKKNEELGRQVEDLTEKYELSRELAAELRKRKNDGKA